MIWQYLRLERIYYRHGTLIGAYQVGLRNMNQYIFPCSPRIHGFHGLVFACRLTYTELPQVSNPASMRTKHFNLNKLLYLLHARRRISIDELQLTTEGQGTSAVTSEIDVDEVQKQMARTVLELRRQYETVDFQRISYIHLRTPHTDTPTGGHEIRHFRLSWEIRVGRRRRRALGGPIQRRREHSDQAYAREIRLLERRLSFDRLDTLLNEMEDTPEPGIWWP